MADWTLDRLWWDESTNTMWKSEPSHDFERERCSIYLLATPEREAAGEMREVLEGLIRPNSRHRQLLSSKVPDTEPLTIIATKGQFLAAFAALAKAKGTKE